MSPRWTRGVATRVVALTQHHAVSDPATRPHLNHKRHVPLGCANHRERYVAAEVRVAFVVEIDERRVDKHRVAAGRATVGVANQGALDLVDRPVLPIVLPAANTSVAACATFAPSAIAEMNNDLLKSLFMNFSKWNLQGSAAQ